MIEIIKKHLTTPVTRPLWYYYIGILNTGSLFGGYTYLTLF